MIDLVRACCRHDDELLSEMYAFHRLSHWRYRGLLPSVTEASVCARSARRGFLYEDEKESSLFRERCKP
jgi:hypothetical protein